MTLEFSKYHGLGNDFLLVFEQEVTSGLAASMCNRHFGVGADGVIRIGPSDRADFSFVLFNSDGSPAEISGNGLRCAGKFLYETGRHQEMTMTLEAAGEVRSLQLMVDRGTVTAVKADMGVPEDRGEIQLHGMTWRLISTGNPHAVTLVSDIQSAPVQEVGPLVETDRAFPGRTNVEFVEIRGNDLHVRFWERGVGMTLASGSGSCAALAASGLKAAAVHTEGGDLIVEQDGEGRLHMTGPAVHVFDGRLAELAAQAARS